MLPRTPLHRWLAVALFFATAFYFQSSIISKSAAPPITSNSAVDDLTFVKEVLAAHKVGPEITYASRTIRYVPDARSRLSLTEVDEKLFPEQFKTISVDRVSKLPASPPIPLHVKQSPRLDQVDASSLLFAVSTTYERFTDENINPTKEWVRWLTDGNGHTNGAGLILALTAQEEENKQKLADNKLAIAEDLASKGINATVVSSDDTLDMAGRYVALVSMLHNHPTHDSRKFFVLIDDDTFFPYMSELLHTLSDYNPAKTYYIGTYTERIDWLLQNHDPMAYGGGGIFLTAPAVREIDSLPCLQKNEQGGYVLGSDQGDHLLYNCIHNFTQIRLTYLPLLHQEDQFGDPSGFYESGKQPLSLHHYKSWHRLSPDKMQVVSDACGESCVLQRFQFKDNFIVSNGFSVAHYPKGIDFDPLLIEDTFDGAKGDFKDVGFSYSFGTLRDSLSGTGKKESWDLLDARREGDGRVKQIYLKRRSDTRWTPEGLPQPENDSIVVLLWIP